MLIVHNTLPQLFCWLGFYSDSLPVNNLDKCYSSLLKKPRILRQIFKYDDREWYYLCVPIKWVRLLGNEFYNSHPIYQLYGKQLNLCMIKFCVKYFNLWTHTFQLGCVESNLVWCLTEQMLNCPEKCMITGHYCKLSIGKTLYLIEMGRYMIYTYQYIAS